MFKNEFQGGSYIKVIWANGKDPLKWKTTAIKRNFEKDVKGFIYILEGSTTTSILHYPPTDSKQSLCLIQRYFVVQVFIPLSKDFAVELRLTDIANNKRRVVLSTSVKDISPTPLHAKLPLSYVKRDVWLNLCFDLTSLVSDVFSGQTFKSLESFCISGNCKFRQAFTMKNQPADNSSGPDDPQGGQFESIPSHVQFTSAVSFLTQVISVQKIRLHLSKKNSTRGDTRETSGYWSSSSDDLGGSRRHSSRSQQLTHLAFGTKVPISSFGNPKHKSLFSYHKDKLSSANSSTDIQKCQKVGRKLRSSNVWRSVHNNVSDKENSNNRDAGTEALLTTAAREAKQKLIDVKNIRQTPYSELGLPSMLTDSVDELDTTVEIDLQTDLSSDVKHATIFNFLSQPHSVCRTHMESCSILNDSVLKDDFVKSSSESDESDNIHDLLMCHPPSPQNDVHKSQTYKFPKDSNQTQSKIKIPSQPLVSMSPDISRVQSPLSHVYDSKKYSNSYNTLSNVLTKRPPINQSMSMRSSDATLTASVDTLLQESTRESGDELEIKLVEKVKKSHLLFDSDTSPPKVTQSFNGSTTAMLHRTSMREISPNEASGNKTLHSSSFKVATLSDSFEANMLASMKREAEEDMRLDDEKLLVRGNTNFNDEFEDSFDTSWSKPPPKMQPDAYESEMKKNTPSDTLNGFTLGQSNPRDWSNLLSPPTVLPSIRVQQKKDSMSEGDSLAYDVDLMGFSNGSSTSSIKSSTTGGETDEEEMLDLLYDPCLNCYFDPKTGKYYELKT